MAPPPGLSPPRASPSLYACQAPLPGVQLRQLLLPRPAVLLQLVAGLPVPLLLQAWDTLRPQPLLPLLLLPSPLLVLRLEHLVLHLARGGDSAAVAAVVEVADCFRARVHTDVRDCHCAVAAAGAVTYNVTRVAGRRIADTARRARSRAAAWDVLRTEAGSTAVRVHPVDQEVGHAVVPRSWHSPCAEVEVAGPAFLAAAGVAPCAVALGNGRAADARDVDASGACLAEELDRPVAGPEAPAVAPAVALVSSSSLSSPQDLLRSPLEPPLEAAWASELVWAPCRAGPSPWRALISGARRA